MSQPRAAGGPRLAARPRTAQRAAALLAALTLARCGGAPTRTAPAERRAPAPDAGPPTTAAAVAPARWVDASGATAIGPDVPGGTLALVGGRRVLVASDGAVRPETAPCPEPLLELALVPTVAGARVVGRGTRGVYRFDDPLGAPVLLARSGTELLRIGGGPSVVAVWDASAELPSFLDVDTGQPRTLPGLPALPLRAVAFRDLQQGAGLFEAAGLAVTADGGASWRPVTPARRATGRAEAEGRSDRAAPVRHEDPVADPAAPLHVSDLRLRGGELRALLHGAGAPAGHGAGAPAGEREAVVLVAEARLAPGSSAPDPAEGAPLLRWIHETGRAPLEVAISGGAAAGAGAAIAASHGLLARVDIASGAPRDLVVFGRGSGVGACGVGRAGRAAWIACALGDEASDRPHDPFGVRRIELAGGRLGGAPPVVLRSGEAALRVSPSGGAMLLAPCGADEEGSACVRQPSGRWIPVRAGADIHWRGAGPLADGRIAIVRGLWDSDRAPRDGTPRDGAQRDGAGPVAGDAPGAGGGDPTAARAARGVHVAVIDARGREEPLIPLGGLRREGGDLHVISPIEEGLDGALSFVVADQDGALTAVVAPPGGEASRARLDGAARAVIHAGHGVAVGHAQVLASTDAGRSWLPIETPARVTEAIAALGDLLEAPGALAVNEVGLKIDGHLRVGWGPAGSTPGALPAPGAPPAPDTRSPAPASQAGTLLLPHGAPPPELPERALVCTTLPGPSARPGVPPPRDAQERLAIVAGDARPGSTGQRPVSALVSDTRRGMLSPVAALEVRAPGAAAPGAGQRGPIARTTRGTWTLRWFDPGEHQGRVRSWTGPAPHGVGLDATLARFAASGDRTLFGVRAAGRDLLIRARPGRGAEIAEVPEALLPEAEVAFSEAPDGPIAWLRGTSLLVWSSGEAPRPIASLASRGARALGPPTAAGVPLLLDLGDLALGRTVPIPPPAQGARGVTAAPPPRLPLDGWEVAPSLRRTLTRLPACGARPRGTRFLVGRASAVVIVDGRAAPAREAVYDVRVSGADACVTGITALLDPAARGALPPGAARGPGPLAFVRADLAARRAEGGAHDIGDDDGRRGGPLRRLACSLSLRP
ncbi:hypothetical protein [Sorangium cellulosum]|uniref:hypothetical protein n=1 Tax=Sorangium cellulosum TaxID=56 RepID=UPI0010114676|nr:hypothetical protein [Sorangium cellulosum]